MYHWGGTREGAFVLMESHGTYGHILNTGQNPVMQEILIRQGTIKDNRNYLIKSSVFLDNWATPRCTFMIMLKTGQRNKETHSNQLFPFLTQFIDSHVSFFKILSQPRQVVSFLFICHRHSMFSTWAKGDFLFFNSLKGSFREFAQDIDFFREFEITSVNSK